MNQHIVHKRLSNQNFDIKNPKYEPLVMHGSQAECFTLHTQYFRLCLTTKRINRIANTTMPYCDNRNPNLFHITENFNSQKYIRTKLLKISDGDINNELFYERKQGRKLHLHSQRYFVEQNIKHFLKIEIAYLFDYGAPVQNFLHFSLFSSRGL